MKKINLTIIMIILTVSTVFGQSTELSNRMEKAKEYEAKKQYVSALSEYYDAMTEEQTISGSAAYEGWMKLSEVIQSGKPGYGEFDEFSFVDEWINQLRDFEKFWTEKCPIMIICDEPERIQLNREEKTATYEMKLSWKLTPKYKEIEKVFKTGLKKAYSIDWQMSFLEKWPSVSVYNTSKDKNTFLQNGAALVQNILKYNNTGSYIYSEYKLLASLAEFGCIKKNLAGYYDAYEPTTVYDVKLKIIDDTEQEIFSGKRLLLGPIAKYTFTVTQNQMQKIDNKKIKVIPDSIFLQYGNIPTEPWITEDSRAWIKTLSELTLDNNSVQVIFKEQQKKFEISSIEVLKNIVDTYKKQEEALVREEENQRRKEKEEAEKNLELKTRLNVRITNSYLSILYNIQPNLVKNKFYERSYYDRDITEIRDIYICDSELRKYYYENSEKFITAMQYVMCNAISSYENLKPVYNIAGHEQNDFFVDELNFYLLNYDKVESNLTANGYRIPSDSEIKAALRSNPLASKTRTIIRNVK